MPGLPVGRSGLRSKLRICDSRITPLVDRAVRLELVHHHRGAWRAVALAKEVLGRVPARVLRQELRDELGERIRVAVDAEEGLLLVLAGDAAEARAGSVDEDEIGGIEEDRKSVV